MSICSSHQPFQPVRARKQALRAMVLSVAAAFVALSVAGPAWANASLKVGQVWSGGYRCAAFSGRASVEITRFEPIAERPGWQRIEATLTIEENGRRGVARFAANNPTRSDTFLLGLKEWVEQPAGVEFQRLRLQPMSDAGGVARIGVNVHGRPECIVNGADTFAFMTEPARLDRGAPTRTANAVPTQPVAAPVNQTVPPPAPPPRLADITRAELVAALPPPAARPIFVPHCGNPDNIPMDASARTRLGEAQRGPHPMVQVIGDWARKHFRFTGPYGCVDPPFVIARWQETVGNRATGVLTAADVDRFIAERDKVVARVAEQRQANAAAAEARRQAEAVATEERRRAEEVAAAEEKQRQQVAERGRVRLAQERERSLRPLLVKTADPQSVYLQAGRFERSSDYEAARQLYEHLVDNFSKTPWAVKANDRLLSLRAQESSRQRAPEGSEARASTAADRARMQAAGQDEAMRARARMQQDMFDEMDRINEESRRRMEEDRRRFEEQQRAENEARERANEIRRRQQEEWEAEERRRRGG